jgi:hypothetical protein
MAILRARRVFVAGITSIRKVAARLCGGTQEKPESPSPRESLSW